MMGWIRVADVADQLDSGINNLCCRVLTTQHGPKGSRGPHRRVRHVWKTRHSYDLHTWAGRLLSFAPRPRHVTHVISCLPASSSATSVSPVALRDPPLSRVPHGQQRTGRTPARDGKRGRGVLLASESIDLGRTIDRQPSKSRRNKTGGRNHPAARIAYLRAFVPRRAQKSAAGRPPLRARTRCATGNNDSLCGGVPRWPLAVATTTRTLWRFPFPRSVVPGPVCPKPSKSQSSLSTASWDDRRAPAPARSCSASTAADPLFCVPEGGAPTEGIGGRVPRSGPLVPSGWLGQPDAQGRTPPRPLCTAAAKATKPSGHVPKCIGPPKGWEGFDSVASPSWRPREA